MQPEAKDGQHMLLNAGAYAICLLRLPEPNPLQLQLQNLNPVAWAITTDMHQECTCGPCVPLAMVQATFCQVWVAQIAV